MHSKHIVNPTESDILQCNHLLRANSRYTTTYVIAALLRAFTLLGPSTVVVLSHFTSIIQQATI